MGRSLSALANTAVDELVELSMLDTFISKRQAYNLAFAVNGSHHSYRGKAK